MTTIDWMTPDAKRLLDAGRELKHCRNRADVARLLGESEQTISNWGRRGVPKAKTVAICKILGCRPEWLETGAIPMTDDKLPTLASFRAEEKHVRYSVDNNVEPGPTVHGGVPLITWEQAGDWKNSVNNLGPWPGGDPVPTTAPIHRHTYALKVTNDSMTSNSGGLSFPVGTILVVEPEMEFISGDFVVVKVGDDEPTVKQVVKDGPDWFLVPLNSRYPVKPLPEGAKICGVVRRWGGALR